MDKPLPAQQTAQQSVPNLDAAPSQLSQVNESSESSETESSQSAALKVSLEPNNARRLANLCGQHNQHIRQIENRLNIEIRSRGNLFVLSGTNNAARKGVGVLEHLYEETEVDKELTPDKIHLVLQQSGIEELMHQQESSDKSGGFTLIRTKKCTVKARGQNQQSYVQAIQTNDINFGIGPAGTGKTYLAVACAVESLLNHQVERIVLVRPAVEAGEKLGFLPGDLAQKVDPYLRPLYDALYEMLGFETVDKLIERCVIEVAPLAYMRGRTLNNCFVILDESQNTTREQMKMFLTRIGFGSTAVINGDPSQVDLPKGHASGLAHASFVLDGVNGISFTRFTAKDVVRHPLVQRIIEAYDKVEGDGLSGQYAPQASTSDPNPKKKNNNNE